MLVAAKISLLVLSVLIALGGIIGFLKAQSKASLISGIVSGGMLITAYSVAERNAEQGLLFGALITAALCVVFGIRLKKTGKVMPSGMLLGLSAMEMVFLIVAIVMTKS